jgi:hypothetical protein
LLVGLLGACQSPEPSTPGQAFPNQGSFPPPAFTGFPGTVSPSDFHHRPFPSTGWTWQAPTMMDLPCCVAILLDVPSPLPRRTVQSFRGFVDWTRRPSPCLGRVGVHDSLSGPAQSSRVLRPAELRLDSLSGGFKHVSHLSCSLRSYRGVPQTPRAGLAPAG